ncbi:MAG: P-II family nitrogen regulator, partial [Deltaproteobacteria bacterium]|nr:P-II family nitrogen regulator [Deltaproteobacteria bacterium]
MSEMRLITCIVVKGKGGSVISEAMNAGAQGATSFTG